MGTRVNYEIMQDDDSAPCVILYSNNSHPEMDPEAVFCAQVDNMQGVTSLVASLLDFAYHGDGGNHRHGDPVFTIDTAPGDRELIYRLHADGVVRIYRPDGSELEGEGDA